MSKIMQSENNQFLSSHNMTDDEMIMFLSIEMAKAQHGDYFDEWLVNLLEYNNSHLPEMVTMLMNAAIYSTDENFASEVEDFLKSGKANKVINRCKVAVS